MTAGLTSGSMSESMSGSAGGIPRWVALAVLFAVASTLPAGGLSAQDGDDLGQVTYERWCAGCHGVDGTGDGDGAGYIDGIGGRVDANYLRESILDPGAGAAEGFETFLGVMPPIFGDQLNAGQLEAVVQFLASQR